MKTELKKGVDIGGKQINLLESLTEKFTHRWMLLWLGTGELGPADGSQITDLLKYGFQKHPTFETDFNIFCPQAVQGYGESDALIQDHMLRTYGEDIEIFTAGHSLGGRNVMELSYGYNGIKPVKQIVGYMPIAGEMSWPLPTNWCDADDKPTMCFAGSNDLGGTSGGIWYGQSQKYADAMNSCPTRKNMVQVKIIPGYNHTSIMDYVFDDNKDSEAYKFIMSCWSPEVVDVPGTCIMRGNDVVFIADNGQERILNTI